MCPHPYLQQQARAAMPDLSAKTSWCQTASPVARGMKTSEQVNAWTRLPTQTQGMAWCLSDGRAPARLCQGKGRHQHTEVVLQEEQKAQRCDALGKSGQVEQCWGGFFRHCRTSLKRWMRLKGNHAGLKWSQFRFCSMESSR